MSRLSWETFEPEIPCTHPGGHEADEVHTAESTIPYRVLCPHCGEDWTIVVMAEA